MSTRQFRVNIGATTVVGEAEDSLRAQVSALVARLKKQPPPGGVRPGASVDLGFGRVHLEAGPGGVVQLCAPDYAGDPFADLTTDLSVVLRVQHIQEVFTSFVGLRPVPTRFDQVVVVEEGALEAENVYLVRAVDWSPGAEHLSGWFLGQVGVREVPVEPVPAYRLLALRPSVVPVLALPDETFVEFVGDEAVSVQDSQRQVLWEVEPELHG